MGAEEGENEILKIVGGGEFFKATGFLSASKRRWWGMIQWK
jgi:hypothetical protein